jgi:NitT/TauT family transport system substrate-binding protein
MRFKHMLGRMRISLHLNSHARRLLAGASLFPLLFGSFATATDSQVPPALTIASSTFDSATAGYYAVMAGLFKKAGLNVTFVTMTPAAIPPAVIGGTVQIASSNLFNVVEAYAHNVPFTVIAPGAMFDSSDENGYVGLIVRKDSTIRAGRDLNNKTIGVPALKDFNTLAAMSWIDQTGGDSATVHFVEVPAPTAGPAVVAGRIDATVLTVPFLGQTMAGGEVRVLTDAYSSISKSFLGLGWVTTKAYADEHPDVVARFSRAIRDAAIYVNAHHEETVQMMADLAKVDPSMIRGTTRVTFAPYLTAAMVQPVIDVSAKYHVIDKAFSASQLISPAALQPAR